MANISSKMDVLKVERRLEDALDRSIGGDQLSTSSTGSYCAGAAEAAGLDAYPLHAKITWNPIDQDLCERYPPMMGARYLTE